MKAVIHQNRLGICTWSLQNDLERVTHVMQKGQLRWLHLDVSVAEMFLPAIEKHGWNISSTMVNFPQEDYSTLESIRKTGGIVPDDFWPENRKKALDAIGLTGQMGVPQLSTHVGFIDVQDKYAYAVFKERLLELADAAAVSGILLLLETGQETADELKQVLEALNHPSLGVNFDPANMILYGKGDPLCGLESLAPWIRHVHLKDAIASEVVGEWGIEVPWGDGAVHVQAFLEKLDSIAYSGKVAIEREAGETREKDILLAAKRTLGR